MLIYNFKGRPAKCLMGNAQHAILNNGKHFSPVTSARKKARRTAFWKALMEDFKVPKDHKNIVIFWAVKTGVRHDADNIIRGMKSYIDGIFDVLKRNKKQGYLQDDKELESFHVEYVKIKHHEHYYFKIAFMENWEFKRYIK